MTSEQQRLYAAIGPEWQVPPKTTRNSRDSFSQWGCLNPRDVAAKLVSLHLAATDGERFRAIRYDAEAAAQPDLIWLPNEIVDGVSGEVPPLELLRQTSSVDALYLLINLYGAHRLFECGGVLPECIYQSFERRRVGEQGAWVVWGFIPGHITAITSHPTLRPLASGVPEPTCEEAVQERFSRAWSKLVSNGLMEIVGHIFQDERPEAEVIHPLALAGTGLEVEQELARSAHNAGLALVTNGQRRWAEQQGCVQLTPIKAQLADVQMLGVVRLKYRPHTSTTAAWMLKAAHWRDLIETFDQVSRNAQPHSMQYQGRSTGINVNLPTSTITRRATGA